MIYLYKSLFKTHFNPVSMHFLFKTTTTVVKPYSTLVRSGPGIIINKPIQLNSVIRRFATKNVNNQQKNTTTPKAKKIKINEVKRLISLAKPHKLKISCKFKYIWSTVLA